MTWDDDYRLSTVKQPSGALFTYTYQGTGQRFSKQSATTTTQYVWDGKKLMAETNASGTVQAYYTQGEGEFGSIVSRRDVGSSQSDFVLADAQGTAANLTDASASITSTLTYDPFGLVLSHSGSMDPTLAFIAQQGYYYDSDLGLYYIRQRWYDPVTRQFISPDRLGLAAGDPNFQRYCGNNPVNRSDPSGMIPDDDLMNASAPDDDYTTEAKKLHNFRSSTIARASHTLGEIKEQAEGNFAEGFYRYGGGEEPSDWSSFIPVVGPLRCAVYDYRQPGIWNKIKGTGWAIMAVSDVFMVGSIERAIARGIEEGAVKAAPRFMRFWVTFNLRRGFVEHVMWDVGGQLRHWIASEGGRITSELPAIEHSIGRMLSAANKYASLSRVIRWFRWPVLHAEAALAEGAAKGTCAIEAARAWVRAEGPEGLGALLHFTASAFGTVEHYADSTFDASEHYTALIKKHVDSLYGGTSAPPPTAPASSPPSVPQTPPPPTGASYRFNDGILRRRIRPDETDADIVIEGRGGKVWVIDYAHPGWLRLLQNSSEGGLDLRTVPQHSGMFIIRQEL